MTRQLLQILLGVVILICSTPRAMANKALAEDVRAVFFAASDSEDEVYEVEPFMPDDFALLPTEELETESEDSLESEEEAKREQKRQTSHKTNISKCRFSNAFSAGFATKGIARHPQTQDAQQDRTAMIRFLQISALDC